METTWIVIADRAGARIFANAGRGTGLKPVKELLHPEGRLHDRDIDADRPGRSFDRFGQGRHAMEPEESATARAAERFAKELAELLDHARTQHDYAKLVLVAEPRFLGLLRGKLNTQTERLVVAAADKDLSDVREHDLPGHLGELIAL